MPTEEYFDVAHPDSMKEKEIKYNGKQFLIFYGKKNLLKHKDKTYDLEKYINVFFCDGIVKKEFIFLENQFVIDVAGTTEVEKYRKENKKFVSSIKRAAYDDEKKDLCRLISSELNIKNSENSFISWNAKNQIYESLSVYS